MRRGSYARTTQAPDINTPVSSLAIKGYRRDSRRKSSGLPLVPTEEMTHLSSVGFDFRRRTLKIYVYIQMQSITNVPERKGSLEIELRYGKELIPKLDKDCLSRKERENRTLKCPETFSFPVIQDSIDDLNDISDNPVMITLYENAKISGSDMEESDEYQRVVVAQGYIDLLGYFSKKRFSTSINTFLYPIDKEDQLNFGTCQAVWHIYALLPLLKNLEFSNIAFMNFESIYNCNEDIMDDPEDLMADLAFRALIPNQFGKLEVNSICSFSGFTKNVIKEQNPYFTWESAKSSDNYVNHSFGFQSDNKVNIYKLFKRLLRPQNVPLSFGGIDMERDIALVCNSMHRFVLTEELRALLEDVFVFRQQQLIVRLYRLGTPENIILEGIIEPSVFLYPFVNAVRFAALLRPPSKASFSTSAKKGKGKKESMAGGDALPKQMFAIVSMCLLSPISESVQTLVNYTKGIQREKFRNCHRTLSRTVMAPYSVLIESAYDSFDAWLADVVDHIVQNNIQDVSEAKSFFCCQSENVSNKILKLIAVDFNRRIPTKTNIGFCNMMTTVYRELVERAYEYIKTCGCKDIRNCRKSEAEVRNYIITMMNYAKYACDSGNDEFGNFLFEKLKERYSKNIDYNFYMFLVNVEYGNFKLAKDYIARPIKDRQLKNEYFTQILNIYIHYMENRELEEKFNEAREKLLSDLREFLKVYQKDTDGWVLLYCLYKDSGYLPGMEYARWHYEDLFEVGKYRTLKEVPFTRWRIYCNYEIEFKSVKASNFYETVKLFQAIGAYKFAEIVFNEIASECADIERHLVIASLKIFLEEADSTLSGRTFPPNSSELLKAFLTQVNGNLSYFLEDNLSAMHYYSSLIELLANIEPDPFELGLRRYAHQMASQEQYELSIEAYRKCCDLNGSCIVVSIDMGKALYKAGRLEEAKMRFQHSTQYKIHIPEVWGYLALINLRLGNNFEALECWKYAKLNPETVISDEIIEELNQIDISSVDLYVDKPV